MRRINNSIPYLEVTGFILLLGVTLYIIEEVVFYLYYFADKYR